MLKNELINYFKSIKFYLIIILGLIVLYLSGKKVSDYYESIRYLPNFDPDTFGISLFEQSIFGSHFYFMYISLISSLMYSYKYLKEKNSKFGIYIINRMGYFKYFITKIFATIITSFFTQMITMLIYLVYCFIRFGSKTVDYTIVGETQFFYLQPYKWLVLIIFVFSLYVTIISLISFGFSNVIKKYYLMYPFSALFVIGIVVILNILNSICLKLGFNIDFLIFTFPLSFLEAFHYDLNFNLFFGSLIFYLIIALMVNLNLYIKESQEYL